MMATTSATARDRAAADYLAAHSLYADARPDSITYQAGVAQCTRHSPLGTVVLVFAPRTACSTITAHVAAARAAGNTVGIALTYPVSPSLTALCEGMELAAGREHVHRLREGDAEWSMDAAPHTIAVVTEKYAASGENIHLSDVKTVVGRTRLVQFYSSRTVIRIPIEVVDIPRPTRVSAQPTPALPQRQDR